MVAIELDQMIVQVLWNKDNILMQIPHFTKEIVEQCESYNGDGPIESILISSTLMMSEMVCYSFSMKKMANIAVFCDSYPNVDVSYEIQDADDAIVGDPVENCETLERDMDEEDIDEDTLEQIGVILAPYNPKEKREGCWTVIGDTTTNTLHSLKHVGLHHTQKNQTQVSWYPTKLGTIIPLCFFK